jgi:hypothetical protein
MTNKQLYNLVFENFVQAKRELIKEGYRKESFKDVDFNEVFGRTKSVMQEEKIKSLKRENEMLKKKLQKEGLFDMFGKKQQSQTQQREPKQVWLEGLTKVFGSNFVNQYLSKMDDKSLSDFYKPINNLFLEGGGGPIFGALMDVLGRTDGINFKNLNQDELRPLSSQLMLLNQFMNLFKIIETKFGSMSNTMITSLYKSNVTNPTQKEVLSQLVKKSKESGKPISEVLGLISTYAKPNSQNIQKENVFRAAALGKQTDALGSETIWDFLTKVSAMAGSKTAKADIIANELEKNKEFTYKDDKEKFKYKYINFRKSGLNSVDATQKALDELKVQNKPQTPVMESKKRRKY